MVTVVLSGNVLMIKDIKVVGVVGKREIVLDLYFSICEVLSEAGLLSSDSVILN
jgi:hypothetical protein